MSWLIKKMLNGKNIKGLSPNKGDTLSFGSMGVPRLAQWVSLKEAKNELAIAKDA